MQQKAKWKIFFILVCLALAVWQMYPLSKLKLGLDLQGGMHLVLSVDGDKAVETIINQRVKDIEDTLKRKKIKDFEITRPGPDEFKLTLPRDKADSAKDIIKAEGEWQEKAPLHYRFSSKEAKRIKEYAIDQALETIRNRVDEFGVAEPAIQRQGKDKIIVQLAGIKNPGRAKQLLGRTALLEFKLVNDNEQEVKKALSGGLVPQHEIMYMEKEDDKRKPAKIPLLIRKKAELTGANLVDAYVGFTSNMGRPVVHLKFDRKGAAIFARVTGENIDKRLAIVLDGKVYSAPVIRSRIPQGQAIIEGRFTQVEAKDLAVVLRAGALPAPVVIEEERIVGPSLGQDSIDRGIWAGGLAGILVMGFMTLYYRRSGLVANFALIVNIIIMLGIFSTLDVTITLPGIAGIILTIGMAVDANILIFERIREEYRKGKPIRLSISSGFQRAIITIFDSNFTTLIAGLILFRFGTGPIRGFAVTLSVGILVNLFTAVFVSRCVFDLIYSHPKIQKLSI
jgi:preprotein translocase subunit SecD